MHTDYIKWRQIVYVQRNATNLSVTNFKIFISEGFVK